MIDAYVGRCRQSGFTSKPAKADVRLQQSQFRYRYIRDIGRFGPSAPTATFVSAEISNKTVV